MTPKRRLPKPFLEVIVRDLELDPALLALCAGFEAGKWRSDGLARHLFEWLLDFAFTDSELDDFDPATASEFLARAAKAVYQSERYERRGEFGEMLLHAIVRQEFGGEPAISKVFFKDALNATVHGFDAVHVVLADAGELELWLGEVKFYGDVTDAMAAVAGELRDHTAHDWLRDEFLLVANKIDDAMPHAVALRDLIHRNTSIDKIFARMRIPVLVTYDSGTVGNAVAHDAAYGEAFECEVREYHRRFARKRLPEQVVIHLLLLPLADKQRLIAALDEKLRHYREL
ncbi:MAG: hypothetical protein QOD83_2512 [Solirubrobacteraceae bacterium]|jgi:hypothetical protein|nr:hypothetical protein [Solirubrobacteraceae bacterium]